MASESGSGCPPPSPKGDLNRGLFDSVKKLTHDHVKQGWREAFSTNERRPYYYNIFTRESVWSIPTGQPEQQEESQAHSRPEPDVLAAAMAELSGQRSLKLSQPPFVKGKRKMKIKHVSDPDEEGPVGKKMSFAPDPNQEENDRNAVRFHIGGERYAFVKRFKDRVYVNIREYYLNQDQTKLLAGKKGVNLPSEEWMSLYAQSTAITEALEKLNQQLH